MTRCKICGITRIQDALQAVSLGADALGFVFYKPSPRYIAPADAARIIASLPPFVTTVGLMVDHDEEQVRAILQQVRTDRLQFHGGESDIFCQQFGIPYYKSIGVTQERDLEQGVAAYPGASALLLDTHDPVLKGGTGRAFNWDLISNNSDTGNNGSKPIILAGGLNPANVYEAIERVRPYAVDVSGGVESAKGIKDAGLMKDFLSEVRRSHAI